MCYNNTIINNSVSQSSSGVALTADTAILTNNTISNNSADNSAGSYGGGVKLSFRSLGVGSCIEQGWLKQTQTDADRRKD